MIQPFPAVVDVMNGWRLRQFGLWWSFLYGTCRYQGLAEALEGPVSCSLIF